METALKYDAPRNETYSERTMSNQLRNPKVVLGMALIWGAVWIAIGAVVITIIGIVDPPSIDPGEGVIGLAPRIGTAGFICGLGFCGLLAFAEKRATFSGVSLLRVAGWGMVAAVAVPVLAGKDFRMGLFFGPLGAISALVAVAVARWWTSRPASLKAD